MKILLDYFFPVTAISPTPAASTAFLKQVCLVVLPKSMVATGTPTLCTSSSAVAALTDNDEADQLFAGGLSRVYILPMDDLDLATALAAAGSLFHTVLISSDFDDADVTADLDLGAFSGVVGLSSDDSAFCAAQAAIENRCAFLTNSTNKAQNMCFAFGKLLSNALNWANQQYVTMPLGDGVDALGDANALFDDKVSFVITDDEFGHRLALFCAGGKAITAPYIVRNFEIDVQSRALSYISANQPGYTRTQAALLEDEVQKVPELYIQRQWIEEGTIEVKLENANFVASAYMDISEPKALWRVFGQLSQTL